MKNFKDYYMINESEEKKSNFCYMLYPDSRSIIELNNLRKSLQINFEEPTEPKEFHNTIRYVKMHTGQLSLPFLEWLDKQELPSITAFTDKFSAFDNGECLVSELDSPDMHEWFNKVDSWLSTVGKYEKSDFPSYKPHVTLGYGFTETLPKFDPAIHRLKLNFNIHVVSNTEHDKILIRTAKK